METINNKTTHTQKKKNQNKKINILALHTKNTQKKKKTKEKKNEKNNETNPSFY